MGKRSRRRVKPQKAERVPFVARTFEGLPGECDWVAMREIVPAATAPVRLRPDVADDREIRVCTLLPGGSPGSVRSDGAVWLGLQVQHNFGDVSRDLAAVLEQGLDADRDTELDLTSSPGRGRRLQDLVDPASELDVAVHDGFDYWLDDVDDTTGGLASAVQAANDSAPPTVRLDGVDAAYWTRMGNRRYLRWVMPHDENRLLDAFARLRAAGEDGLGADTRLIGMFRAHGLLVPVWEMDAEIGAGELEEPATAMAARLPDMLADRSPLTSRERSVRNGLANRQLTIR